MSTTPEVVRDPLDVRSEQYQIMKQFSERVNATSRIEEEIRELIKIRASQINGCAYCVDMHTRDARKHEETERRLYLLSVWRESPGYSDRERAALELTEAVTMISEKGVSDDLYQRVREQFSFEEYIDLILIINVINGWNRLSLANGLKPPAR